MKSSYYKAFEDDLLRWKLSNLGLSLVMIHRIKRSFPAPNKPFPNPQSDYPPQQFLRFRAIVALDLFRQNGVFP